MLSDLHVSNSLVVQSAINERLAKEGIDAVMAMDEVFPEADSNDVFALSLKTRKWQKLVPHGLTPFNSNKLTSWLYNHKIYLFGGYGPAPDEDHKCKASWFYDSATDEPMPRGWNNQLVVFDPNRCAWDWPKTSETPLPRAAHAAAVNQDAGYALLFGGRHGVRRLNDLHYLDLKTLEWEQVMDATTDDMSDHHDVPCGRSWHSLTYLSDHRFLLFGGFNESNKPMGDCWLLTFNPAFPCDYRWQRLMHLEDPLFGKRIWHVGAKIPDQDGVMIIGGFGTDSAITDLDSSHSQEVIRLILSPKPLFSLALDASCETLDREKKLNLNGLPGDLVKTVQKRLPKYLYDRALTEVVNERRENERKKQLREAH